MGVSVRPSALQGVETETVLGGGVTLALGAPYVGKTVGFEQYADETSVALTDDLSESTETDAPVVVDDFYEAFQEATPEVRQSFLESLPDADGLCLSTRPRDFEWLCDPETEAGVDRDTGDALFEAVETVVDLRYPTDFDHWGGDWEGQDATVPVETLQSHVERLTYEYEFDDSVADGLGMEQYGPTLVPPAALKLDDSDSNARAGVSGSVREYVSRTGLSILTDPAKELGKKAAERVDAVLSGDAEVGVDRETFEQFLEAAGVSIGSALGGSAPIAYALGLALWRGNPGEDVGGLADEIFEHLLDDRFTPVERAKLERGLGLAPRTLETVDGMVGHEAIDVIAGLDDLQDDLAEMQDEVRENSVQLKRVVEEMKYRREQATRGLTHLEQRVREEERTLLQTEVDPDDVEYLPDEEGNEVDQLRERIEDDGTDVVVLRGPHARVRRLLPTRPAKT